MKIPFVYWWSAAIIAISGCITPHESARMLPKGSNELRGAATQVFEGYGDKVAVYKTAIGLGYGYGFSDRFNMKMRAEFNTDFDNYLSYSITVGPKFSLKKNKWALFIPVSMLVDKYEINPSLSFGFAYTPFFNDKIEVNLSTRSDIFFGGFAQALNLGLGIGNMTKPWMLRPDLGFVFGGEGEYYLTFGIAADYRFFK